MRFHGFQGSGVSRPLAALLKESFTRFQLAAVIDSSIRRIWRLAGWLAGLGWAGMGWAG